MRINLADPPPLRKPAPTREQILTAMDHHHGGPVTVGPLSFTVCALLGVDTTGHTAYDLRSLFSWSRFTKTLEALTQQGALISLRQGDWYALTGGTLFAGDGHHDRMAYATAATAATLRAPLDRDEWHYAALHIARERVLREHDTTVTRYAEEWLAAHPRFPQEDTTDGHA